MKKELDAGALLLGHVNPSEVDLLIGGCHVNHVDHSLFHEADVCVTILDVRMLLVK